jgi:hypothetical protein
MAAEETSSNAPRREGENIIMRSMMSKVVTEFSESPKWRDLPENIKEETVKKLKEPYSKNTGALYTEADVQELMQRPGSICGKICAERVQARQASEGPTGV